VQEEEAARIKAEREAQEVAARREAEAARRKAEAAALEALKSRASLSDVGRVLVKWKEREVPARDCPEDSTTLTLSATISASPILCVPAPGASASPPSWIGSGGTTGDDHELEYNVSSTAADPGHEQTSESLGNCAAEDANHSEMPQTSVECEADNAEDAEVRLGRDWSNQSF
jgi:hypothetical protein